MRSTVLAIALTATPAIAQEPVTYSVQDSFDNVAFAIESEIIGAGLVIDYVSHTGEMLERTREDIGSEVKLFTQADIFLFCSAAVSRQVMEADLMNIQHCPYAIFVAESAAAPGAITVGYRDYPPGPMDAVEALLAGIVNSALGRD